MSLTPYNSIDIESLFPVLVVLVIIVIGLFGWVVIKVVSKVISIWLHNQEIPPHET